MAHQFECAAPDCVFLIRAADEEEVIAQVRRHSEEQHDKSPPPAAVIRDRMETVDVE
jgi:predicted small metal-binding protein